MSGWLNVLTEKISICILISSGVVKCYAQTSPQMVVRTLGMCTLVSIYGTVANWLFIVILWHWDITAPSPLPLSSSISATTIVSISYSQTCGHKVQFGSDSRRECGATSTKISAFQIEHWVTLRNLYYETEENWYFCKDDATDFMSLRSVCALFSLLWRGL